MIAIAQEDKDLKSHARFLEHFPTKPRFEIVADLNRKMTKRYRRVTTYIIDKQGIVREIAPALIHMRPTWRSVLNKLDELNAEQAAVGEG